MIPTVFYGLEIDIPQPQTSVDRYRSKGAKSNGGQDLRLAGVFLSRTELVGKLRYF